MHEPASGRFVLSAEPEVAVLEYREVKPEVVAIERTFVPPGLRGQGVAARLVEAALEHARKVGWRIVPDCTYVETYLKRNPAYEDLRA